MSETLHIDDECGLWIPTEYREFENQVVFRTPKGTIQHFSPDSLGGYYGMITESAFGPEEDLRDPRNPELCPNQVSIKPAGEDAVVFEVEIDE